MNRRCSPHRTLGPRLGSHSQLAGDDRQISYISTTMGHLPISSPGQVLGLPRSASVPSLSQVSARANQTASMFIRCIMDIAVEAFLMVLKQKNDYFCNRMEPRGNSLTSAVETLDNESSNQQHT